MTGVILRILFSNIYDYLGIHYLPNGGYKIMKLAKITIAILFGFIAAQSAFAQHHGHGGVGHGGWKGGGHVGVYIGGPFLWPGYYGPYPYYAPYYSPYYYPPVVTVPTGPTTYIEQGETQAAPEQAPEQAPSASWYYCAASKTYYPYVKQCPGGWQRVAPQPPPQ